MALPSITEGTGEELQRLLEQHPTERFRLVALPAEDPTTGSTVEIGKAGSLYDLLGDFVGCIEGSGENNASRASDLFAEHLAAKRKAGHL